MPMSPRLLRPLASGRPIAIARDSGGNVIQPVSYSESGENYIAHIFTDSGTLEFLRAVDVDYLVVAGGGGGGGVQGNAQASGGGGGAGGFLTGAASVTAQSYNIAIGAGGAGGIASAASATSGSDGSSSSGLGISATGGGGGGKNSGNGQSGGSGGGAGQGAGTASGTGISGQGNDGASAAGNNIVRLGGGGGGAGAAGTQGVAADGNNASTLPAGGDGLASTLSGASVFYSGGGGGGQAFNNLGVAGNPPGGVGGGGAGERAGAGGSAGSVNTGGGGGGAGRNSILAPLQDGFSGGSGIVIVRYKRTAAEVAWDSDALAYIAAVETADANTLEPAVRTAINDFVTGCKSDGIWDSIKASCILAGARTLAGALVPLKGTAPTNNNFVSGDYDRATGLVGNGTTKYLDSNRANNADPQNSNHNAVYVTDEPTITGFLCGNATLQTAGNNRIVFASGGTGHQFDSRSGTSASITVAGGSEAGLIGLSRSDSSDISYRLAGTTATASQASVSAITTNVFVFSRESGGFATDARLAFYSIGESLDLADLDTRVSALITAIGAAV